MTDTQADLVERLETEVKVCEKKGWYSTAAFLRDCKAEIERLRASNKQMADALQEADEILTGEGWHTDRGLLSRIRAARRAALKDGDKT